MFAVRYAALAALVLAMAASLNTQKLFTALAGQWQWGVAFCAAVITASLFVMKFVGPPPHAFVLRAGIAFLMVVLSAYAGYFARASAELAAVNLMLGLLLLGWYARE